MDILLNFEYSYGIEKNITGCVNILMNLSMRKIMNIDKKINTWTKSTGSIGKDVCKAFVVVDIITAIGLYIILSILIIGGMI